MNANKNANKKVSRYSGVWAWDPRRQAIPVLRTRTERRPKKSPLTEWLKRTPSRSRLTDVPRTIVKPLPHGQGSVTAGHGSWSRHTESRVRNALADDRRLS